MFRGSFGGEKAIYEKKFHEPSLLKLFLLFQPQMTPKTHSKKNSYKNSEKNDFEKSSGLPASLDGYSWPRKIFFFQIFSKKISVWEN